MVAILDYLLEKWVLPFDSLPVIYQQIVTVAFFMMLIFFYSIFVWKVYKTISHKDIISLNLRRYNSVEHAFLNKLLEGILYFIEYIIILPFLILFWYILFALVLLFFSESISLEQILLLSAAVVGSIRLLAYYNSELSSEIAKLLPLTILAITLLSPKFLRLGGFVDSVKQIPELLLSVGYAIFFIIGLEIILRLIDTIKKIITD